MRNCFYIKLSETRIAIADLCDYYGKGFIITRINVPEEYRGRGFGTQLLAKILEEADREKVTLFLEILASGELDSDKLRAWYERHGFKDIGGIWQRKPKQLAEES